MNNRTIARAFRELGQLLELHRDNPYKIRSYQNAYMKLRKLEEPLEHMTEEEWVAIPGIGKAIAGKIGELLQNGRMETLEKWRDQTPAGVVEMMGISGFGPKKVRAVWQGLGVESVGELQYAVNENRLIELKGFGAKTQEDLRKKLAYYQASRGKFLYRDLEAARDALLAQLTRLLGPAAQVTETGAVRRREPTPTAIELLVVHPAPAELAEKLTAAGILTDTDVQDDHLTGRAAELPVIVYCCAGENFGSRQFRRTGTRQFLEAVTARRPGLDFSGLATEQEVFDRAELPVIPPEMREGAWAVEMAAAGPLPRLIEDEDIRGVVHNHSVYSDGINTVAEMAEACIAAGYEYLVMSDHSRSAGYAGGLKIDRVQAQWAEIDALNERLAPFRILKSIESDILADGSLDYPDEVLAGFDLVIASVHSNLRMSGELAMQRLLTAVANPYTSILGHPTGRLLLTRPGYPVDHRRLIDACADHGVAIELNANPLRLDLDWSWIPHARERGVLISINPDAHATGGIADIRYGVMTARKGGLTAEGCLNTRPMKEFLQFLQK